jgi:hypothetical protein
LRVLVIISSNGINDNNEELLLGGETRLQQKGVENPILEKVRSGASRQTFALPAKKKVSEQMEVASAHRYASILKKGLKWAPVTVHSF